MDTKHFFFIVLLILLGRPTQNFRLDSEDQIYNSPTTEIDPPTVGICNGKGMQELNISLNFANMNLVKINSHFINTPYMTDLNLENNKIHTIDDQAFDALPNLRYLNLAHNQIMIDIFLSSFDSHHNLRTLILNDNFISDSQTYTEISIYIPNLQRLSLQNIKSQYYYTYNSYNSRNFFPYLIKNEYFPNLTHLDLSDNVIDETIWEQIPMSVTHLYLKKSKLSHVDGRKFKNLVSLSLDDNDIKIICKRCYSSSLSLQAPNQLQFLSVSHNQIQSIHTNAFNDAINLLSLDLSYNLIQIIEETTFLALSSLRNLSLDHNKLLTVPDLNGLQNLTSLSLSYNNISLISEKSFFNFSSLRNLLLNNNRISNIAPESFFNLTMLEELDLSYNLLSYLPSNFIQQVNNLRYCYAEGNLFTNFENIGLNDKPSLLYIYIEKNPLKSISVHSLISLPKNATIILNASEGL